MQQLLDTLATTLGKSINELDIKLSFINIKINKLNKHITYIYLILLLNTLLNIIFIFR
jgi:hypothetical protein